MRVNLSSVLEILGAIVLLVAAGAWDWRAAAALVGVALLVLSFLIDDVEVEQ